MTGEARVFIIILILNLVITVIYLIWNLLRKEDNRTSCWIRAIVMLLCPVTGIVFFAVGHLFFILFFHKEVDLADVIFNKDRTETYVHADEERGRNLIPVEEAMLVTEKEDLRNLMLNVLRGDIQQSLSTIAQVLGSEDTEASHYAASALHDVLNSYRADVQKLYQQMQQDEEERLAYARMLIDYMDQILCQHVLTEMEQKSQVDILDEVCEVLYNEGHEEMRSSDFEIVCMRLLEVESFERCREWCDRAEELYPNALASYSCKLKLYYTIGEGELFMETLQKLRSSDITIDHETLEMIRVFM